MEGWQRQSSSLGKPLETRRGCGRAGAQEPELGSGKEKAEAGLGVRPAQAQCGSAGFIHPSCLLQPVPSVSSPALPSGLSSGQAVHKPLTSVRNEILT